MPIPPAWVLPCTAVPWTALLCLTHISHCHRHYECTPVCWESHRVALCPPAMAYRLSFNPNTTVLMVSLYPSHPLWPLICCYSRQRRSVGSTNFGINSTEVQLKSGQESEQALHTHVGTECFLLYTPCLLLFLLHFHAKYSGPKKDK